MQTPALIRELPLEVRYVLGDVHDNDPKLRQHRAEQDQILVATRHGLDLIVRLRPFLQAV